MQRDYTEYDTERVRRAEQASAGVPTRQLASLPSADPSAPQPSVRSNNNTAALALIAVGIAMLLSQIVPLQVEFGAGMILLTIASCFLFFSFWKRIYGLLIPGAILAGLSFGVAFAAMTSGVSVLWGLASGFLAIQVLGRKLFRISNNWPVYVAVPLFAVGGIVAVANLPSFFAASLIWLPLVLVGAGLYLGWGRTAH